MLRPWPARRFLVGTVSWFSRALVRSNDLALLRFAISFGGLLWDTVVLASRLQAMSLDHCIYVWFLATSKVSFAIAKVVGRQMLSRLQLPWVGVLCQQ